MPSTEKLKAPKGLPEVDTPNLESLGHLEEVTR
jgi:hypothetical protein